MNYSTDHLDNDMSETWDANSVRVKIYGQEYVLRTEGDPKSLLDLCEVLDKQMRNVAEATGSVDTIKIAVLVALNIADEARRAKEEVRILDEAISKRSTACVTMLDRFIS